MWNISWLRLNLLGLLLLTAALPSGAARDIVYAARYYYPPGVQKTSHFHLYRINPDGTGRTQLTFGPHEDDDPHWLPDGRHVVFLHDDNLSEIGENGGPIRTLCRAPKGPGSYWQDLHLSPDGRTLVVQDVPSGRGQSAIWLISVASGRVQHVPGANAWETSPDGRHAYVCFDTHDELRDLTDGRRSRLPTSVAFAGFGHGHNPLWRDGQTLIGIATGSTGQENLSAYLRLMGLDGRERQRVTPQYPQENAPDLAEMQASLLAVPGDATTIIYVLNAHNSTVGVNQEYLRLDLRTGRMTSLAEGQFFVCSPDGRRFCFAPGRDTTPYEKRKQPLAAKEASRYREVWAAPLYVRAATGGRMRQLTPRLSYVTGADWRKPRVK